MYNNSRILAIIPARGGSKRLPGKNIKNFAGQPLLAWTINAAKKSQYIDRIVLTSEDDSIIQQAIVYGCEVPFKRSTQLAQDQTSSVDVILDVLNRISGYDYLVLLQPTSPLRTTDDIDACIDLCLSANQESAVSVTLFNTHLSCLYTVNGVAMQPLFRTIPPLLPNSLHYLNGAIYVCKVETVKNTLSLIHEHTKPYVMPYSRSIDIDTEEDFLLAERLMNDRIQTIKIQTVRD